MKKFLVVLGTVGLTATSSMAVIACTTENSSEKAINSDLGTFDWGGAPGTALPDDDDIIDAFNKVNSNKIELKNVTISEKTRHSAIITAKPQTDGVLKNPVEVHYSLKNQNEINLSGYEEDEVLTNLGEINHATKGTNWLLPSGQDVLDGFLSTNEFLFKDGMEIGKNVEIKDITSTSATIKALKGTDFTGQAKVTFITKESKVNVKTTKYEFKQNVKTEQIISKIEEDNSNLNFDELIMNVSEIKDHLGTVKINVKEDSTIYSPNQLITINFSIEKSNFVKPEAFQNFKDEKLDFNATKKDVIETFENKYQDEEIGKEPINFGQLVLNANLETQKISINVKEGSTVYNQLKNPLEVQFTVKTVAETKLSKITISGIKITDDEVLKQVNSQLKNPLELGKDVDGIAYNDDQKTATIKLNANKYGEGSELVVEINFVDTRSELKDVITDTNLGELENNDEATVKAAIDAKYNGLTSETGITVTIENNTAKVSAKDSEKYQDDEITLTFTIKDARKELKNVFKDSENLGTFKNTDEITSKLKEEYKLADGVDGIKITINEKEGKVVIEAADSKTYKDDSVELNFVLENQTPDETPNNGNPEANLEK